MDDQKAAIDSKINQLPKLLGRIHEEKTELRRSKIMIVGEGCAGKTAFANSIIGKKFEETDSFEDHVFHQIVPSDDDDATTAEGPSHHTQISSHHAEVLSSTKDQGSSEVEVIERLVKEMQAQSPSIYTSVKNLIAYLVGRYCYAFMALHCTTMHNKLPTSAALLCRKRVVVRNLQQSTRHHAPWKVPTPGHSGP